MFCFVDIEPNELDRLKALYKGEHKKRLGFYKGKRKTHEPKNWDFGLVCLVCSNRFYCKLLWSGAYKSCLTTLEGTIRCTQAFCFYLKNGQTKAFSDSFFCTLVC